MKGMRCDSGYCCRSFVVRVDCVELSCCVVTCEGAFDDRDMDMWICDGREERRAARGGWVDAFCPYF